ncbi:hypothetical protein LCGC14_1267660 [marine sediment metagenome]|uniref:Uncharacterized protein n=1 Tax=marine sediment metagenome TaxID=412755 RepID=A0A0F9LJW5_9ZZZZ
MPDKRKKKRTITVGLADLKKQTISVPLTELEAGPVSPPSPPSLLGEFGAGGLEATIGAPSLREAGEQFLEGAPYLLRHPLESAKMMGGAALEAHREAAGVGLRRMREPGLVSKGVGALQYAASGVPLLGPAMVLTGEEMARGDISLARGAGRTVGTLATLGAGRAGLTRRQLPVPPRPKLGRTGVSVEGIRIPQAAGEATGGALVNKVRSLLEGSLVGEPLKRFSQAQQRIASLALKKVSDRITQGINRGWWKHEMPADAFHGGANALRSKARPLYENIDAITSELAPGAPERIGAMTGQARAGFMRYRGKVTAVAKRMTDLLSDLDIKEMLILDPDVASTLRSRLASLQTAERLTVPFETFKSTRTALMSLRRRASKAGKHNASRLLSEAIDAVDDSAGEMLKAIDSQRGTSLAADWRSANNMWRRAALSDELAEAIESVTTGARPSIQRAAGMRPVPPIVKGGALIERLKGMKKDIEGIYGEKAYRQMETIGEVLRRGQAASPGNIAGHSSSRNLGERGHNR